MTKKVIRFGAAVMITGLAVALLWQFRIAIIYVLISLAVSATIRPLINRLAGRGFVVRAAWVLLYLVVLGSFAFLLFLIGERAIVEIQQFGNTVSVQDAWRLPGWLEGSSFQLALVAWLPPPSKLFEAVTGNQGQFVLPAVLGFSKGFGGVVSGLLVILLLSVYWSIHQVHFEQLWLSLLPSGQRNRPAAFGGQSSPDLGAYIRSELVQSLLAGLLLGLGYWLLGSPYPALLALVGALAWSNTGSRSAAGSDPATSNRTADQYPVEPVYGALYAHRFDRPAGVGRATPLQTQVG